MTAVQNDSILTQYSITVFSSYSRRTELFLCSFQKAASENFGRCSGTGNAPVPYVLYPYVKQNWSENGSAEKATVIPPTPFCASRLGTFRLGSSCSGCRCYITLPIVVISIGGCVTGRFHRRDCSLFLGHQVSMDLQVFCRAPVQCHAFYKLGMHVLQFGIFFCD